MIKIPETAGLARIRLSENATQPLREGDLITLPLKVLEGRYGIDNMNQFILLKDGAQFMLGYGTGWRRHGSHVCFFGGTDEQPFLVQVSSDLSEILEQEGESAFYEALKPLLVKDYKQRTGQVALRQGDIFAYPCLEWESLNPDDPEIKRALRFILGADLGMEKVDTSMSHCINSEARIFGTRHILHGFVWPKWQDRFQGRPGVWHEPVDLIYATGVIKTPDHTDLVLNVVHVLTRAVGIVGEPWEID